MLVETVSYGVTKIMFFALLLSCPLLRPYPCLPKRARNLGVDKSARLEALRAACQLRACVGPMAHRAARCGARVRVPQSWAVGAARSLGERPAGPRARWLRAGFALGVLRLCSTVQGGCGVPGREQVPVGSPPIVGELRGWGDLGTGLGGRVSVGAGRRELGWCRCCYCKGWPAANGLVCGSRGGDGVGWGLPEASWCAAPCCAGPWSPEGARRRGPA